MQVIEDSAITIKPVGDPTVYEELRAVLDEHFDLDESRYLALSDDEYRDLLAACQQAFNERDFHLRIARAEQERLIEHCGEQTVAVQSHLYLRGTRPLQGRPQEHVGWHRESFYGGAYLTHGWNLWMPLRGVSTENAIKYIAGSHTIPDEQIILEQVSEEVSGVKRFSSGHKVGLLYSPKQIVGGVDLSDPIPFDVPEGSLAIFPSDLIHGNAANATDRIRFSVDFRFIAVSKLTDNKAGHITSGQDYFIELDKA